MILSCVSLAADATSVCELYLFKLCGLGWSWRRCCFSLKGSEVTCAQNIRKKFFLEGWFGETRGGKLEATSFVVEKSKN